MTSDVTPPGPRRIPRHAGLARSRQVSPSTSKPVDTSRRDFLSGVLTGSAVVGISTLGVKIRGFGNTPVSAEGFRVSPVRGIIDNTVQAKTSHLGDTWVRQTLVPKSEKVIEEFELVFEIESNFNDVTGAGGIGAKFELKFVTQPGSFEIDPQWVEITPWQDGLNGSQFIDPTKPSEHMNWTIENIIESFDPTLTGSASSGLVRVKAVRKDGGYELTISWDEIYETYDQETGERSRNKEARSETYTLPISDLYGIAPAVKDARDLRDIGGTSLFAYQTGMHHLNKVNSYVAVTKLTTSGDRDFEPTTAVVSRSGIMYEAEVRSGYDDKDYKILWVEPLASDFKFTGGISLKPYDYGYGEPGVEIVGPDDMAISAYLGQETSIPASLRELTSIRYTPFALQISLGELNGIKDFIDTIAVVEGTRTVTWVAPTINGLVKVGDILNAVDLANGNAGGFPTVRRGQANAQFTPIELATGLIDLSSLDITLYQEHQTSTDPEDPSWEVTAEVDIFGDDIFAGHIDLPREFDMTKPIQCLVASRSLDDLPRVPERYPVIDPLTPVLCYPPQSRV